jgi:hypothetical protein
MVLWACLVLALVEGSCPSQPNAVTELEWLALALTAWRLMSVVGGAPTVVSHSCLPESGVS